MNYPQQGNGPQSITEKAEFLDGLREMVEITRSIMSRDEASVKKLHGINGTMVVQKLNLGADHMALKDHFDKELFLPINTPNDRKAVLIVKAKSTGSIAGAQSYDVSIEGFLCQNPSNIRQIYGVRYDSGKSMLTIRDETSKAILGTIALHEYNDNFSAGDVISNENDLKFEYKEEQGGLKGEASYNLQTSSIKFNFRSKEDLDYIKEAITITKNNLLYNAITGGSSTDLAALFN